MVYKIIGILIIIFNSLLIYISSYSFYPYNFTNTFFLIRIPNIILVTYFILGFTGVIFGILSVINHYQKPLQYILGGILTLLCFLLIIFLST